MEPPCPPEPRLQPKLGIVVLAALGLAAFVAFPGRAFRTAGAWIQVEDRHAGHAVSMPGAPKRDNDEVGLLGVSVHRQRTRLREYGRVYALTRFELAETGLQDVDPERLFDDLRDRWMSRTGGELTLERSFELGGGAARELVATSEVQGQAEILHRARIFLSGSGLYRLEYRGPFATVAPTDLETFFGSFRSLPPERAWPEEPHGK